MALVELHRHRAVREGARIEVGARSRGAGEGSAVPHRFVMNTAVEIIPAKATLRPAEWGTSPDPHKDSARTEMNRSGKASH